MTSAEWPDRVLIYFKGPPPHDATKTAWRLREQGLAARVELVESAFDMYINDKGKGKRQIPPAWALFVHADRANVDAVLAQLTDVRDSFVVVLPVLFVHDG
jgi:hypothetical protein